MGWTTSAGWTPTSIIKDHTTGWDGMACLDHKVVPENDYLVLWTLMEYTKDGHSPKGFKWIGCVLIGCFNGHWGYKDMDESVGPCYYGCPLEFLDKASPPTGYAVEWRDKVREYNSGRKAA